MFVLLLAVEVGVGEELSLSLLVVLGGGLVEDGIPEDLCRLCVLVDDDEGREDDMSL